MSVTCLCDFMYNLHEYKYLTVNCEHYNDYYSVLRSDCIFSVSEQYRYTCNYTYQDADYLHILVIDCSDIMSLILGLI